MKNYEYYFAGKKAFFFIIGFDRNGLNKDKDRIGDILGPHTTGGPEKTVGYLSV